jgi:hypothetical protein
LHTSFTLYPLFVQKWQPWGVHHSAITFMLPELIATSTIPAPSRKPTSATGCQARRQFTGE